MCNQVDNATLNLHGFEQSGSYAEKEVPRPSEHIPRVKVPKEHKDLTENICALGSPDSLKG